jgi:hypothetical protein
MEVEWRNHEAELLTLKGLHPSLFSSLAAAAMAASALAHDGCSYAKMPTADLACHGRSSAEMPTTNLALHGCPFILPQRNKFSSVRLNILGITIFQANNNLL